MTSLGNLLISVNFAVNPIFGSCGATLLRLFDLINAMYSLESKNGRISTGPGYRIRELPLSGRAFHHLSNYKSTPDPV